MTSTQTPVAEEKGAGDNGAVSQPTTTEASKTQQDPEKAPRDIKAAAAAALAAAAVKAKVNIHYSQSWNFPLMLLFNVHFPSQFLHVPYMYNHVLQILQVEFSI